MLSLVGILRSNCVARHPSHFRAGCIARRCTSLGLVGYTQGQKAHSVNCSCTAPGSAPIKSFRYKAIVRNQGWQKLVQNSKDRFLGEETQLYTHTAPHPQDRTLAIAINGIPGNDFKYNYRSIYLIPSKS